MMRALRPRLAITVLAAAALAPSPAAAQGPGAAITLAPADVVFPSPNDVDFDAGWVDHGSVAVTVEPRNRNRQNWQLFVQASAADMGGYGKPVSDILVRASGSPDWVPLSTAATLVAEGTGAATITLYYRLLLAWSLDSPGAYTVPLEYSASSF